MCGEGEKVGETRKTRNNAFCTNTFDPLLQIASGAIVWNKRYAVLIFNPTLVKTAL